MASENGLLGKALLGVVIADASHTPIAEILASNTNDNDEEDSFLPSVKQRSLLFFDERLTVYLVLRFPLGFEAVLKQVLPRLDLRIDLFAGNGQPNENDARRSQDQSSSVRDLIFSQHLQNIGDPFIALDADQINGEPTALAIWEVEVTLNRPRTRLPTPAIVFSPTASLKPDPSSEKEFEEDDLPSFEPLPFNVFDALKVDPAMQDDPPVLSSSKLNRILPMSGPQEKVSQLPSQPSKAIRIIPAVSARVRYSRVNTFSKRPSTVASLDYEVTPFIRSDVELDTADVKLTDDGLIEPITDIPLPIICRPKDDLTFLYRLSPSDQSQGFMLGPATVATLDICFSARILLSSTCTPRITMRWRTSVDFSMPLNPSYGAPSQTLQRNNRPNNLPVMPINPNVASSAASAGSLAIISTSPDSALTISFTARVMSVQVGSIFSWHVLVVNHSSRARKLALIAITSRASRGPPHNPSKVAPHEPNASLASHRSGLSVEQATSSMTKPVMRPEISLAPAVLDENILYAIQRSSFNNNSANSTTLICMSPDVHIGPLGSGAAHECEIKFLALKAGWTRLEGIRVISSSAFERDSMGSSNGPRAPGEWMIRDLPDILVVDSTHDTSTVSSNASPSL